MKRAAVIMAGGAGTRLWPLSRRNRPKQLLRIVEGRSLLRIAFERLRSFLPDTDIYVIALAEHLPAIGKELPEILEQNLIGEPVGRDTANAVALSAAILHRRDPETTMGVFTADHLIRPTDRFAETVRLGFKTADENPDALVTFGIKPTHPETGFGYVHRGDALRPGVWNVKAFREKPDLDTARQYVASGDYYWNSGMFAWKTRTILGQLADHLPQTHDAAVRMAGAWHSPDGMKLAAEVYPELDRISIDFAVMEKAPSVLVVEMNVEWIDVGSWTALPSVVGQDRDDNTVAIERLVQLDSRGNVFVSEDDHLIAAIGVKDLVVVHSRDATLICHKDQAQRIKEMVGELQARYDDRYD
ncbi:MAG: mannose-1-phosphate guanylyltransferase [Planctomycetota bacterium]|nr:mannose-1-phosphate guanylyltransferase [Planctomycetota bacterium]